MSQLKKIDDYENIYSVNPLYLIIDEVDGHIEEKNESKYLVFDSTDKNKEVLERYTELLDENKNKIEAINTDKDGKYGKDFIKIKYNTDNDLPLNKPLKLHMLTIIVRSVFQEGKELYPQIYINECLHGL